MFMIKEAVSKNDPYSTTQFYSKLDRAIEHATFLCDKYHGGIQDNTEGTSIQGDIEYQGFSLIYANNSVMSVMQIEKIKTVR